jgi:glycerol-3-phosphate acyltransferase PlsY
MIPLLIAAGYLLGSIPVAWLVAKWVTGQDLRRMGSGNDDHLLLKERWSSFWGFLTAPPRR